MITQQIYGGTYASDLLKMNKIYMAIGSTGGTQYNIPSENDFEVGVAPIPCFTVGIPSQIQQGPNLSFFRRPETATGYREMVASWLFAKHMLEPENTAKFAIESGYIPCRSSAFTSSTYLSWLSTVNENPINASEAVYKLVRDTHKVFLDTGERLFCPITFNLSSKTRTEVGNLLRDVFAYTGPNLNQYIEDRFYNCLLYILS
jgi:multiple sugar transport system substrate-binding protein